MQQARPTPGTAPRTVAPHPSRPPASPADLPDLLRRLVEQDPAAMVVLDKGPEGGSLPVTCGELEHRCRSLAASLADRGVGPGGCVAVWLPNWSEVLVWQFAVASLGGHVIGLNTRYNVDEVAHVLRRAEPVVLALAHGFHGLDLGATLVRAVAAAGTAPPSVAVVTGPGEPPIVDPSPFDVGAGAWVPPDGAASGPPLRVADPARLVVAFTTSGSTGLPKLAAHTGAGVVEHARADAVSMGLAEGDAVLCALPLSGTFGYSTVMATLAAGGICVLQPVFDPSQVLDDLATHGVTHVVGGDDLVLRLHDAWVERPRDLAGWRWCGLADFQGRARELAAWARDAFGTVTSGVYGSSEVFALTSMWPAEEPEPARWDAGGRVAHDGIEVRVVDPGDGSVAAAGLEGELQFRGPNVVDAYLGDPEALRRAFTEDGWFRSGDLGVLVDEGAFVYVCRIGDALRLRGFLVDPAEIELRLAAHPSVRTARVVGIESGDGSTRAVAFVVLDSDAVPEADGTHGLRAWCADALAAFKVPDAVHCVEALPTVSGPNGTKVLTGTLREWARQRAADR